MQVSIPRSNRKIGKSYRRKKLARLKRAHRRRLKSIKAKYRIR